MNDRLPADLDEAFAPRRARSAYTVEVDGEAIVLDEDANRLHLLNETAALVWACFDGTGSLGDIAHDLADATGVPLAEMLTDVVAITRRLGAEGLVVGVAADPGDAGVAVADVEVSGPPA